MNYPFKESGVRGTAVDVAATPGVSFLTPAMIIRLQQVFDDLKATYEKQQGNSNMAKLDFCVSCAKWIAANTGTMRKGPDGEVEIICDECLSIEQRSNSGETVKPFRSLRPINQLLSEKMP